MPNLEKRDRLKLPHIPIPKRPPSERIADFCEATLTYSPEQAAAEAGPEAGSAEGAAREAFGGQTGPRKETKEKLIRNFPKEKLLPFLD